MKENSSVPCSAQFVCFFNDTKKKLFGKICHLVIISCIKFTNFFRQLGPPTLFLTLSSSEYAWDDLLISLLKTKHRRDICELLLEMKTDLVGGMPKDEFIEKDENFLKENAKEIVEAMTSQERNRFINSNIVLTTIEFQNRVAHIFKQLKTKGFLDDSKKYRLEDSFFRIEHQVISESS